MKKLIIIFITFLLVIKTSKIFATHVRAGEIIAKKVGGGASARYNFTFYLYKNSSPNAADQKEVTLYFGDGSNQTSSKNVKFLNDNTDEFTFNFTHTYQNPGVYTVYTIVENRNGGILNITNSDKVNFYIETQILIDPLLGQNSTPVMKFPPIDKGATNQIFTHNPGASDPDGDSLVFELIVPKFLPENDDVAREVPGHRNLNNSEFNTVECTSSLKMDSKTGTITWDRPCIKGEFNIAFKITEFRNGIQIGYLTRDMQIDIIDSDNKKPVLTVPKDTCITANSFLFTTITGSDPDFTDDLNIQFSGASFNVPTSIAFMTPFLNPLNNPTKVFFNWQTTCDHIRQEDYINTFKIDDDRPTNLKLVEFKTFAIKVNGPAISGISALPLDKSISVSWNKYQCSNFGNSNIKIMRKSCSNSTFSGNSCATGSDVSDGFTEIAELNGDAVNYKDTNVFHGFNYCYYVYAIHKKTGKGESKPSALACGQLNNDITYITNVSVTSTSLNNGKIIIKWTKPKQQIITLDAAPYTYEIWRKSTNELPTLVATMAGIEDTSFVDNNLNTVDIQYFYQIKYKYSFALLLKNTTAWASSVKLEGFGKNKKITLSWNSSTPWSNNYPTLVYKLNTISGLFIRIASTTGNSFEDIGQNSEPLINGQKYTYFITTLGKQTVGCQNITTAGFTLDSLLNRSQIIEGIIPKDSVPPCTPEITINNFNCDSFDEIITLRWKIEPLPNCENTILGYRLYYSKNNASTSFDMIQNFDANKTSFQDVNNKALEGCYKIKSYRNLENGNTIESNFSNAVCVDVSNCENLPYFDFPNVFTPEPKDGYNDVLVPKPTPRLVQSLDFNIYNRWGTKVFSTNEININWDGSGSPEGIYYCYAKVKYFSGKEQEFKRWIQLLR